MIKSELVAALIKDHPHLRMGDAERIVDTVFDEIAEALSRGDRVELRGFGAFSTTTRQARMGRNPRTGEPVSVPEKQVIRFRLGKDLRTRLNGSQ